jgi:hypothetical protein
MSRRMDYSGGAARVNWTDVLRGAGWRETRRLVMGVPVWGPDSPCEASLGLSDQAGLASSGRRSRQCVVLAARPVTVAPPGCDHRLGGR